MTIAQVQAKKLISEYLAMQLTDDKIAQFLKSKGYDPLPSLDVMKKEGDSLEFEAQVYGNRLFHKFNRASR